MLVYLYFPFAALTLFAALERFDWRQLHAAMDLGATHQQAMRRVMLPQIKPGITTAVIFVFIPILGEYLTPELVGGTRGVMIGNLVDNFFQEAQYRGRRGDSDPDRGGRDHPARHLPPLARGRG